MTPFSWMEEEYNKGFLGHIKRFDPDFSRVRLAPKMPYERNSTTWDDIMTEIGDDAILNPKEILSTAELMNQVFDRIETIEERLVETLALALSNQKLIAGLLGNQKDILALLEASTDERT